MIKELRRWFLRTRTKYFEWKYIAYLRPDGKGEWTTAYKKKWFLKKRYRRRKK